MSNKSNSILIWLSCILIPLILEILTSIIIFVLYILPFYLSLIDSSLNNLYLILFIYFLCAWLYSIYEFLKSGFAIPKSLLNWHIIVLKFIKENPKKVVIFACIVSLIWYLSPKPEVKNNQLDLIENRVENLDLTLNSINSWAKEHKQYITEKLKAIKSNIDNEYSDNIKRFSTSPNSSQLPTDKNGVEKLSADFNTVLSYLSSRKYDSSEINNFLNEKTGILNDSLKQLSEVKNQTQPLCQAIDIKNDIAKCKYITTQIENLEKFIQFTDQLLQEIKQLVKEINLLNENNIISPNMLAIWEQKIAELQGRVQFDGEQVKYWLYSANSSINYAKERMLKTQQSNQLLKSQLDELEREFIIIQQQYTQISKPITKSIKNYELELNAIKEPQVVLNHAKDNNVILSDLEIKIKIIEKSTTQQNYLDNLLRKAEENYLNYDLDKLRQLSGGGYIISTQARSNLFGKNYVELILNKKKEIDDLHKEIFDLNQETQVIIADGKNKKLEIIGSIGEFKSSLQNLKFRNQEIIKRLEAAILRSNLQLAMIVLALIFILVMLVWQQTRKRSVNRIKDINTNKVSGLIPYIENSNEPIKVRFYAIDTLYNEVYSPTQQEIDQIKNKVRTLEVSLKNSDRKVAAKLRTVADAMELRSSEGREL